MSVLVPTAGAGTAPRRRARRPRTRRPSAAAALIASVAVTWALAASCRTIPQGRAGVPSLPPPGPETIPPSSALSVEALVPPPIVRVGIVVEAPRASLAADSGVVVRAGRGASGRESHVARATFTWQAPTTAGTRYRVRVAGLASDEAVREVADRVRTVAQAAPVVRWRDESRSTEVRVGDFGSPEAAAALVTRLRAAGIADASVAEEILTTQPARVKLLETGEELTFATVVPADPAETLSADGLTYRGVFEVRSGEAGLVVVNAVNIEDYLKGVVPNELSPDSFPELEALKAQAVAARTYVLRNRDEYASKGYDICATPTCQVYRGKSTERPLSSQAVDDTRGMAAVYQGALINALYTSTCGGHTETGSNIFEGEKSAPYLVGVSCAPEREAWATVHTTAAPRALGDQPELGRDAALLLSLDTLPVRFYASSVLTTPPTDEDLREWVSRLGGALHRTPCPSTAQGPVTRRGTFFQHLVSTLCWEERAKRLLAPDDTEYLLSVEDRADLDGPRELTAAALLVQEGIVRLFPDNTLRPNAPLTRAQAIEILGRTALEGGPPALVAGSFRGLAGGGLTVREEDGKETTHLLDPAARLFRALDGSRLGASELDLAEGDRVSFVEQAGRITFLEAQQSLMGAAADRSSRYYRWEVRLTPAAGGGRPSRATAPWAA